MSSENRKEFLHWLNEQMSEQTETTAPDKQNAEEFLKNASLNARQPDEIYDETGKLIATSKHGDDPSLWENIRSFWHGMEDGEKLLALGAGLFVVALARGGQPVTNDNFMIAGFSTSRKKDQIGIATRTGLKIIAPVEIIYLRADKNNGTTMCLTDDRQLETCRRLGEIESNLSIFPDFLRVHRSFIINTTFLRGYSKYDNLLELHTGMEHNFIATPDMKYFKVKGKTEITHTIPVGGEYKSHLERTLQNRLLLL
jgi:hypothetical protein